MSAAREPRIELPDRLIGEGVVLRLVCEADVDAYAAAFADDRDLGRWLGFEEDPGVEEVRDMVAGAAAAAAAGRSASLAILSGAAEVFAGELFVHDIAWEHRRCAIGLWVVRGARRQGVARAATERLLRWLFEDLGIERAEMATTADNAALRGFARRLGFGQEGVLRAHQLERGRRLDIVVFGLLREEWRPGAPRG